MELDPQFHSVRSSPPFFWLRIYIPYLSESGRSTYYNIKKSVRPFFLYLYGILFFFAWGLASYRSSPFFTTFFLYPHSARDHKGTPPFGMSPDLIRASYGFDPGSGNLSADETKTTSRKRWTNTSGLTLCPWKTLSSYLIPSHKSKSHILSFWGREKTYDRFEFYGDGGLSSSFSYWKSSVSQPCFDFIFFVLRREALSLTNTWSSEKNPSPSITKPSFSWF